MQKPTYEDLEIRVKELENAEAEHKKIENALKESEEKFRIFMETASDLMAVADENGNFTYVNKAMTSTLDYKNDEMIGMHLSDIFRDDYKSIFLPKAEELIREGNISVEMIFVSKKGKEIYGDIKIAAVYDKNGKFKGSRGVFRDITKRKKTEEKLLKSEKLLKTVTENIKDGIFAKDIKGRYTFVNSVAAKMLGLPENKILGKKAEEIISEKDASTIREVDNLNFKGKPVNEISHLNIAGVDNFLHTIQNPVFDNNGKVIGISGSVRDVTEQKKAEEVIRLNEAKKNALISNISDVIAILDEQCIVKYKSPNIEQHFGWLPEDLIDKNGLETVHIDDKERIQNDFIDILKNKDKVKSVEYRYKCKNGSYRHVKLTAVNLLHDPLVNGILANYHEITERKKVEEVVKESEEKFRLLSESSPMGVFQTDSNGRVMYLNDKWCTISGMKREEAMGFGWISALHPDDKSKVLADWEECLKKKKGYKGEFRFIRPDGEICYVYTCTSPILSKNGDVIGHVGANEDITERKKAEMTKNVLYEVSKSVSASASLDELYLRIHKLLGTITNTDNFYIALYDKSSDMISYPFFVDEKDQSYEPYRMHGSLSSSAYVIRSRKPLFRTQEILKEKQDNGELNLKGSEAKIWLGVPLKIKDEIIGVMVVQSYTDENQYSMTDIEIMEFVSEHVAGAIESKRTEEAIKKNEQEFQSLFKSMREGFALCEVICNKKGNPIDYRFLRINPAFGDQSGMDVKASLGRTIKEIYPDIESLWIERYGRVAITQEPIDFEDYNHNTGKYYNARAFSPEKGKFAMIFKDITERKQAEEALRESEERFRTFMNGASDYFHIVDKDLNLIYANPSMTKKLGYGDLTGMNLSEIFKDPLPKKQVESINETLIKEGRINFEHTWKSKHGEIIVGEANLFTRYGPDNEYNGVNAVFRDVTEQRHLEEQLQIRQRMDSLGTLAGGIAHDFNNILVGIMGNIDLLNMNSENFTEDQKECLNYAEQSSVRAANLIRQFQTLSRASVTGKSAVDIYDISNEVFGLLKETTDKLVDKQIKFKKGEFFVYANPGEIHQALLNLATNSAQAIEERGAKEGDYIRIKAEDYEAAAGDRTGLNKGDYIHILFEDNGIGMPDEVLKKAFDPMFTTKDKGVKKGQGLGLAMVYNIITRIYKGHIFIESEEGKGTSFHLFLPKSKPEADEEEKKVLDIVGGTETILVIDDEENVRNLTEKLLTQIGYTVFTASDGKNALKIYKKQKESIDAVILDLTMPQMSGKQVFQMMLDINPAVKVIISSGHSDEYTKEGILAEAKSHVGKPYKINDLAKTVRTVLDS
ncbi:PAS domain S-box protein [candidate division KSB1 bacterium]